MNLSPKARAYIYGVAAAIIAALVSFRVITADQAPAILVLVTAVLWAAGNLIAIQNTTSVGRAALYGVGLAVLGVLLAFRFISEDQVSVWGSLLAAVFGVGTNALAFVKVTPDVKGDEALAAEEPLDAEGEDF